MSLSKALSDFGLSDRKVELTPLAGGKSGADVWRVTAADGRRFVLKNVEHCDRPRTRKIIAAQEAARALGAPVPKHIRNTHGDWISGEFILEDCAPGTRCDTKDPKAARRFGQALAELDGALAKLASGDKYIVNENDPFQLCRNPKTAAEELLPLCSRDRRFPPGYAKLIEEHCVFFDQVKYRPDLSPAGLVNVDPNVDNAIFDAEHDAIVFIDLEFEMLTLGYSLGPALFWWLYPQSISSIDYRIAGALVSGYRERSKLAPELIDRAALHLIDFNLMELSLPIAFSAHGAPESVDPLERIEERFARARLVYAERERLAQQLAKAGSAP